MRIFRKLYDTTTILICFVTEFALLFLLVLQDAAKNLLHHKECMRYLLYV